MATPIEGRLLQYFQDGAPITPSETVDIARPAMAIYVGTTGSVVVRTIPGTTLTFLAVPVGVLNVQAKGIGTATTAGGLIALYTSVA